MPCAAAWFHCFRSIDLYSYATNAQNSKHTRTRTHIRARTDENRFRSRINSFSFFYLLIAWSDGLFVCALSVRIRNTERECRRLLTYTYTLTYLVDILGHSYINVGHSSTISSLIEYCVGYLLVCLCAMCVLACARAYVCVCRKYFSLSHG